MNKFSSYFPRQEKKPHETNFISTSFSIRFPFSYCHRKKKNIFLCRSKMNEEKLRRTRKSIFLKRTIIASSFSIWDDVRTRGVSERASKRYTSWLVELSGLVLYCFMRMTWCFENCKDFEFIINIFWHQNMLFWWREREQVRHRLKIITTIANKINEFLHVALNEKK